MADSIYTVGNSYRVKVRYYVNGKVKYKSGSFRFDRYGGKSNAYNAAKKFRSQMQNKLDTVNYIMSSKTSMDEMMDYKELLIPLEEETNRKHRYFYLKHIKLDKPFEKVSAYDIQMSLNKMVNDYSQDTIDRVFTIWKQLYRVAALKSLDCSNQTLQVIVPKSKKIVQKRELEYDIDINELYTKIENYGDKYNSTLVVLALKTMYVLGCRPGEVFALENCDINLQDRTVLIKRSCDAKGNIKKTKNYGSYRTIPFPSSHDELFKQLKSYQGDIFIKINGSRLCSNYV
ncbi:MAG: hypothetical protein KBT03_04125, partial [Bacteroidales bacterium]|nr:hypothetical protein [Candidatus Scybalousia scybalohippi]